MIGWADLGGTLPAVSRPSVGREAVSHGVMTFFGAGSGTTLVARHVNGEPGILAFRGGELTALLALRLKKGSIARIYVVADPPKLA